MADVDDRHTFGAQLSDDVEETVRFAVGQRRGRLVHDQDPALVEERARDLDLLLFSDRKVCRALARSEPCAQPIKHLLGVLASSPECP